MRPEEIIKKEKDNTIKKIEEFYKERGLEFPKDFKPSTKLTEEEKGKLRGGAEKIILSRLKERLYVLNFVLGNDEADFKLREIDETQI